MSALTDRAMDALQAGHGFQTEIRSFIKDKSEMGCTDSHVADDVAHEMSTFRDAAQHFIDNAVDAEDLVARRKATNNICNDVSRICRNELGYTIKCIQKKPDYVYSATEWLAPVHSPSTTAPTPSGVQPMSTIFAATEKIAELEKKIEMLESTREAYRAIWENPEAVILESVSNWGAETVGRALVDYINKEKLDSAA